MFQHNPDEFLCRFITVDPLLHTRDEGTVKIMNFTEWEPALKKAKTVKLAGKVMITVFWDARGIGIIHIDYLPSKQMINGDYYTALLDRFNNILKKNVAIWRRRKCTSSHVSGTDGQIQWIPLRIASPSSIFARFSPLRLLPVSKPEEMIRRKEIHHQRAAHRRNRGLFWRVGQIILFRRFEKVGSSISS